MGPVKPTIISRKAGNWVDRGGPTLPPPRRVLAYFFSSLVPTGFRGFWISSMMSVTIAS